MMDYHNDGISKMLYAMIAVYMLTALEIKTRTSTGQWHQGTVLSISLNMVLFTVHLFPSEEFICLGVGMPLCICTQCMSFCCSSIPLCKMVTKTSISISYSIGLLVMNSASFLSFEKWLSSHFKKRNIFTEYLISD